MNTGLLLGQRPEDYIAGSTSPIPFEERNKTGNWKDYCPPGEWQNSNPGPSTGLGDSMSCVTFSALNSIEAQEKLLTGRQVNYSDRWIAKMSGTTKEGNYLYKVADAIRKYGLVLEEDYPTPKAPFTWEQYHAAIPKQKELEEKGQAWLKRWDVKYEWLDPKDWNIDYQLKHAPIQLALHNPAHAVIDIYSPQQLHEYFDSYSPFFKTTPISNIAAAMKIVLTPKTMTKKFIINDGGKLGIAVLEGHSFNGLFVDEMEDFKNLINALDVPADAQTINIPQ